MVRVRAVSVLPNLVSTTYGDFGSVVQRTWTQEEESRKHLKLTFWRDPMEKICGKRRYQRKEIKGYAWRLDDSRRAEQAII